ncbi:MAG: DUF3467 domain-containing protein [Acidobacteria bacterium]|nr:DUF3467 domain-containing protein [Acidobacteriota bacterium]
MNEAKQINFTIVPDDSGTEPRVYANFSAVAHTPFDFTLVFCEVLPLSERDIQAAEQDHVVRAAVKAKVVLPVPAVPALIAALQEHMRAFSEAPPLPAKPHEGPVH